MHNMKETLTRKREERGYTQEITAEFLRIDRTTYNKIENGGKPRIETARKIGELFNIDWKDLIIKK